MKEERTPTEHEEQREFVSWFRKNHKDVRIFAIPNGEKRSRSAAGRLKAEGVSAGVPDLFIPEWGWWLEMKRVKKSSTSTEQKSWHKYLREVGYRVDVCKGFKAAQTLIINRSKK